MQRICIYTTDVIFITGRSERYARDILKDIRLLHQKSKHQLITISEFCEYMGLPYEEVFNMINKISP
ncbi:hypothetical protein EVU94_11210 [Flavobacteriaceae bacterium 144Ye]|nr:hypothetical protein EVU94_11210 [Flavobacteriaceae bacterium 144Ye]